MKEKIFSLGNTAILILFYLLFGITYISAILSDNFTIGDNLKRGTTTTLGLLIFLGIILLVISLIYFVPKVKNSVIFIFKQHKNITSVALFLLLVLVQFLFVTVFHPKIGWDPSALINTLDNVDDVNNRAYFSLNSNNLPILLFMSFLSNVFQLKTWLFFDYLTIVMVDLSIVFSVATSYMVDRRYFAVSLYINILVFGFFPWIVVPYTDTWVLPFVSAFLFFYFSAKRVSKLWQKNLLMALFALLVCGTYFIKPSAIIPAIAIGFVEVLSLLKEQHMLLPKVLKKISTVLVVIFSFIFLYTITQSTITQQTLIHVNRDRAIPAVHFMNMGISGEGGYNAQDTLKMGELATKSEKIAYSQKMYVKRLKKLGVIGYFRFIIQKQINNTADGSFAWGKEGHFIQGDQIPRSHGLKRMIENYLYIYGENVANFRFIAQFIWLIILSCIFFGWHNKSHATQIIRLGITGAFLFLLLFEGGRSRYIIQFLPLFLLGASLLVHDSKQNIQKIMDATLLKRTNNET
ncbi:hypothetical protein FGL74_08795 [Leuconostoc koreense]|nr:hypothetical protein FGL74_08795 [Leuconostoc mesenteroides]QGM25691.1 hypothetical protein GJV51_06755 [Leuconostoc mesenteroides subsp. mesenteroides]